MAERVGAFLYTQQGVNESLTTTAKQELEAKGISFREIDLTGHTLDEEWPTLPVISGRAGFFGNLQNEKDVQAVVSFMK